MEARSARADALPAKYRAILELAGELERRGRRDEGGRLRRDAADAYTVWDERGERRLDRLAADANRKLLGATIGRPGRPTDAPPAARTVDGPLERAASG
jgi:hypothetical protein